MISLVKMRSSERDWKPPAQKLTCLLSPRTEERRRGEERKTRCVYINIYEYIHIYILIYMYSMCLYMIIYTYENIYTYMCVCIYSVYICI